MKNKIIYLSIPYTFDPECSFEIANKVTAELMEKGNVVFSPISHGHGVSQYLKPENILNWDFWIKQDLSMLEVCDEMVLVYIGTVGSILVDESKGCQSEIKFAEKNNIPIKCYNYEE